MMVDDCEDIKSYPTEPPVASCAAVVPSAPQVRVDRPSGLEQGASKVHHLHVTANEDGFKRSLQFLHGGSSTDSANASLAGSKRVALGAGDQRMYRHRASVAPDGPRTPRAAGRTKTLGGAASPTRKSRRGTQTGAVTAILDPLVVEVMEAGDSPLSSAAASPRTDRGHASSAASPLGRSRIATAAPAKPRGPRLGQGDDDGDDEEVSDDDHAHPHEDRKESLFSEDAGSPMWHRSPRADLSLQLSTSASHKSPRLHRSPQQVSLNTSGPAAALAGVHGAEDVRHRQRDSLLSDGDANSPVWHRSPRADLSLDVTADKSPRLHRSPQQLSPNTSVHAAPAVPLYPAEPSDGEQRPGTHADDESSPVWHRSPRMDSLGASHSPQDSLCAMHSNNNSYSGRGLPIKKAPLLHQSPRESALKGYSSAIEQTRGGDRGEAAVVEYETDPDSSTGSVAAREADEASDAESPVWNRPMPDQVHPQNADLPSLSMQSASKMPIMHTSPACSTRVSPPQPDILPVVKPPARQSKRRSTGQQAPAPAPPARKPAVPRFPKRKASREMASAEAAAGHDVPRAGASARRPSHPPRAAPIAATSPKRFSDEEANLSRFVRQYEANADAQPVTTLPAVLPIRDSPYPVPSARSPPPPRALVPSGAEARERVDPPAHGGDDDEDPMAPVVPANGIVPPSSQRGPAGLSLLDQILQRSAVATSHGQPPSGPDVPRKRLSSSCHAALLTTDYRRSYELTAAEGPHDTDTVRHASRHSSAPPLPRAQTTLSATNWKVSAASRRAPAAVVLAEKMDSLVPVSAAVGGGGGVGVARSLLKKRTADEPRGAGASSARAPSSRRGSTPETPPRKGRARSGSQSSAHAAVPLPALVAKAKPELPAAAKGRSRHVDGKKTAGSPVRRNGPAGVTTTARYADSPYLQSATRPQKRTRSAHRTAASPKYGAKKGNRKKRTNAPSSKPKKAKLSYEEILNEKDRYEHVLTHHGFWGENAS